MLGVPKQDFKGYCCGRQRSAAKRHSTKHQQGNRLAILFPHLPSNLRKQLCLDDVALYAASDHGSAQSISTIIETLAGTRDIVVTDAFACIGGNTMNFATRFRHVQAIEVVKKRVHMLKKNLRLLNLVNVTTHCHDYMSMFSRLAQDVIYFDPPWGGPMYKESKSLNLVVNGQDIADITLRVVPFANLIVLKLPTNFDLCGFTKRLIRDFPPHHACVCRLAKVMVLAIDFSGFKRLDFVERCNKLILTDTNANVKVLDFGKWWRLRNMRYGTKRRARTGPPKEIRADMGIQDILACFCFPESMKTRNAGKNKRRRLV